MEFSLVTHFDECTIKVLILLYESLKVIVLVYTIDTTVEHIMHRLFEKIALLTAKTGHCY